MKYKVGDKVKIVSDWKDAEPFVPNIDMDEWLGKTMTISAIRYDHNYFGDYYVMSEDGGGWAWYDEMISGLANKKGEKQNRHNRRRRSCDCLFL